MNKSNLKSYAPHARTDFIAAVTASANLLVLSENDGAHIAEEMQSAFVSAGPFK